MAVTIKRNIELAILVAAGAIGASVLIACIRIIQEHIRHSYSGFGPWQPLFELPFDLFVVGIMALSIQVIAMITKRPKLRSGKNALIFGAICGTAPISTVAEHCCYWLTADIPHFQLSVLLLVAIAAMWFRLKQNTSEISPGAV